MHSASKGTVTQRSEGETASSAELRTNGPSPWKTFAGIWRENPDLEVFLKEVEELRREADEAETKP